jgi:hypothetical protein
VGLWQKAKIPKISKNGYAMMLDYQLLFTIQGLTPFRPYGDIAYRGKS